VNRYQRAARRARPVKPAPLMVEKDYYSTIREIAQTAGWLIFHAYDSRRSDIGFPDFVFVRERVVFAEIKGPNTPVTLAQRIWLERLSDAGVEAYLWRMPEGLDEACAVLGRRVPRRAA